MQEEMIGFSWATLTTILPHVPLLNSLMDMYGKCGEVEYSRRVFDGMLLNKDLTSWNTMLNCYAINGSIEEEMNLFDWMIESGVAPDGVTFVAFLSGCSDTGFTEYGLRLCERIIVGDVGITDSNEDTLKRNNLSRSAWTMTVIDGRSDDKIGSWNNYQTGGE
ncbi:PREDICTED: pentatricopeptide repeat-containing protein At3g14330-like [Camelina sativa]|uniref:Pentatricopeptide repeat-containing protein At3g14330-like n=1 Tax=Camelina sativa TaxID=90675 RepID=A0ABM0T0X1_CAMSA|nr:PREDICTED: pentatricopeptide repeat-containing protein At3g14330-like [Camelina sativa]